MIRSCVLLLALIVSQRAHAIPRGECPTGTTWDPDKTSCVKPGTDRDGDGILDNADQCVAAPEDKDGFKDSDGCPDPDNDGDGVLDAADLCPSEAEVRNGFQDTDGCPDALPKKLEGRTTPHPEYPDWKPPVGAIGPRPPVGAIAPKPEVPKPGLKPEIARRDQPKAPDAPTGYRCGAGGKLVLNKGCTCAVGRTERRDADGVSVCAKGAATTSTSETKPLPVKVPAVKPAPAKPVAGDCPSWKGDVIGAMGAKDYACVRTLLLPRLNDGSLSVVAARYLKVACGALSDRACEKRAEEKLDPPAEPKPAIAAASGKLNINATPAAKVIVDGTPIGTTPKVGYVVPAGVHSVVFVHPERGKKSVTVTVNAGETKSVEMNFGGP